MDVDRQSFIIYKNFYEPIKHLNNTDLGKLFRAIFEYNLAEKNVNDYVVPPEVKIPFEFFRNQFNLDEAKWMKRVNASRENGMKGGRPPQPKEPTRLSENQDEPRKGDTVTDTVTGTVTETENETEKDLKTNNAFGYSDEFEKWWSTWLAKKWRGTGGVKSNAHKYWKLQKSKLTPEKIHTAMLNYMLACSKANSYHKDAEGFLNPKNGLVQQFLDYTPPKPVAEVDRSVPIVTSFKNQRAEVRSAITQMNKEQAQEYWEGMPPSWKQDLKIQQMFAEKN